MYQAFRQRLGGTLDPSLDGRDRNPHCAGSAENYFPEVGTTAAFLASPLSSGITGATIYVDTGYHAMGAAVGTGNLL